MANNEKYRDFPLSYVIEDWSVHYPPVCDQWRAQFAKKHPDFMPLIVYGRVVTDREGRFAPGRLIRCLRVRELNVDIGEVISLDCRWQLNGPGWVDRNAIVNDVLYPGRIQCGGPYAGCPVQDRVPKCVKEATARNRRLCSKRTA
ncbi:hypothetical protein [Motiliproteus sediminis]|uniref:hypothetical protein n=1 Tax=Motiliproteus sediminis TaxID=1468178 RepID=UPI001AEFE2F5|nr:hypothetical protein [Motiliproteus sediminis]